MYYSNVPLPSSVENSNPSSVNIDVCIVLDGIKEWYDTVVY